MGIFAKVLYEILADHQSDDYSYLGGQKPRTDPIWYPLRRLAIAREAINRLKSAAFSDTKRATLNPSDLEYLMERLRLNEKECARLRAALLAQGVEIFLYDRMTKEESAIIADITRLIYDRLLERFEAPFDRVREPAFRRELTSDQREELALSLADRVGTLIIAAKAARERKAHEETHFWQSLIMVGYQEITLLLHPTTPAVAARFEKLLHEKPEDLLDVSPERVEPSDESTDLGEGT